MNKLALLLLVICAEPLSAAREKSPVTANVNAPVDTVRAAAVSQAAANGFTLEQEGQFQIVFAKDIRGMAGFLTSMLNSPSACYDVSPRWIITVMFIPETGGVTIQTISQYEYAGALCRPVRQSLDGKKPREALEGFLQSIKTTAEQSQSALRAERSTPTAATVPLPQPVPPPQAAPLPQEAPPPQAVPPHQQALSQPGDVLPFMPPANPGLTLDNYKLIATGMTYKQVVSITGAEGEELSSNELGGISTVMYQWRSATAPGANMNAMFQNDRLVSKAQFGLASTNNQASEAAKKGLITNSEAAKSSPAAAAELANVGHTLSPQELARLVQEGRASRCAVVTSPAGAEVFIDGSKLGVSPVAFVLLKEGDTPRTVTIKMEGYTSVEKKFVPDGKTIPIALILEKESGIEVAK